MAKPGTWPLLPPSGPFLVLLLDVFGGFRDNHLRQLHAEICRASRARFIGPAMVHPWARERPDVSTSHLSQLSRALPRISRTRHPLDPSGLRERPCVCPPGVRRSHWQLQAAILGFSPLHFSAGIWRANVFDRDDRLDGVPATKRVSMFSMMADHVTGFVPRRSLLHTLNVVSKRLFFFLRSRAQLTVFSTT